MPSEAHLLSDHTGYRLEIFVGVFTPLCIVAVALRFYARSLSASKYDAGDWLIAAALIGQIVAAALGIGLYSNITSFSMSPIQLLFGRLFLNYSHSGKASV